MSRPLLLSLVASLLIACTGGSLGSDASPEGLTGETSEAAPADAVPEAAPDTVSDAPPDEPHPTTSCDQIGKAPMGTDPTIAAPTGVATDGNLVFVTDPAGGAVLLYTSTLTFVQRYAGFDGAMPGGSFEPYGIAVDGKAIYVTDTNGGNGRVLKATPSGLFVKAWGDGEGGDPDLVKPYGLAVADDTVYVADAANGSVYAFSSQGTLLRVVSQGVLQQPVALAVTGTQLLVADAGAGEVVALPTAGGEPVRLDLDGELDEPVGVAVDGDRVLVSDRGASRLVKGTLQDTFLGWCGGEGSGGGQLSRPRSLVVLDGNVFLADYGNKRLVKIHP